MKALIGVLIALIVIALANLGSVSAVNVPPVSDPGGSYNCPVSEYILSPSYCKYYTILGKEVSFDGSGSYDPDGYIVSYEWDFGDGNTSNDVTINHTYTSSGTYTVNLNVTDNNGTSYVETTWATILNGSKILLVDDDEAGGCGAIWAMELFMTEALDDAGYEYDYYEVPNYMGKVADGPHIELLEEYDLIIWYSPTNDYYMDEQWTATLRPNDEGNLSLYLDGGGKLWFISHEYFNETITYFYPNATPYYVPRNDTFARTYLHVANYSINDTISNPLVGVTGDPIGSGLSYDTEDGFEIPEWQPPDEGTYDLIDRGDSIDPDEEASPVFWQDLNQTNYSAIRYKGNYTVVFFAFEFSLINRSEDRAELVDRVLQWMTTGTVDTTPPTITITSPENTTYNYSTGIILSYSADEPISWNWYSLDDGPNTSFVNGTTMISSSIGNHKLTIYANDTSGNWGSDTAYFTITGAIGSCTSISSPGYYYLTQNITNSLASTCIEITSSDVVFDGQGYTIDGIDTGGTYGVYVYNSSTALTNVTVKNLVVTEWNVGIYYREVNGNITNNNASDHGIGINLYYSNQSTITNNNATNNWESGIYIDVSSRTTVINNTASNNGKGIRLYSSSNNTIYNNLFNNTENFAFDGTTYNNSWNTTKTLGTNIIGGPYLGGNFWTHPNGTGFSKTCTDANGDGICDSSYTLTSGNVDHLSLTITAPDTTPPTITVTSPINDTYEFGSPIIISYNSDESIVEPDYYQLDGGANTTFDNGTTTLTPAVGNRSLVVWAKDASGNWGSDTQYFTVGDTTPPTLENSTTSNIELGQDEVVTVDAYDAAGIDTVLLEVDSLTNYTMAFSAGNAYTYTITGPSLGTHNIRYYVNDTNGNLNDAVTDSFDVLDITPPNITIHSPQSTTYTNATIDLQVTADEAIDTWWYNLNSGTNTTFTPNTTTTGTEGSNTLIVYANDSVGNEGSSTVYFTVDTTPPIITITSPANSTYESGTPITITYGSDEAITEPDYYSLSGGANTTFDSGTTTITPAVGSHSITVWAKDASGNWGSDTQYFTVEVAPDTTPPTITITSPQPTTYTNATIDLKVTADETIDTWWYFLNYGPNTTFTPNTTILGEGGLNHLVVYAMDTVGNIGSEEVWFVLEIVDATISISPQTLNLKSQGKWIKATISLPSGYNVGDIDIDTVLLMGLIPVAESSIKSSSLTVNFYRHDIQMILTPGDKTLKVTGRLYDGTPFEGSDTIRVTSN